MRLAQPGLTFHPGRVAGRFMIVDSLRGYVPETGHDHEGSTLGGRWRRLRPGGRLTGRRSRS